MADAVSGVGWWTIAASWLVLSAAFTPGTLMLAGERGGAPAAAIVFLGVAANFLPWALATPLLLRLCRVAPIGIGDVARPLLVLSLAAAAALPTLALAGTVLNQTLVSLLDPSAPLFSFARVLAPAAINAMYMPPVFVAIVGVGQTLAHSDRHRHRERALAEAQLAALRAQVDPHFLFNVLNAIAALAYRDAGQADDALARLAAILRRTLADDRDEPPLAAEIETVAAEVALYRLLVPGTITLDLAVSSEAAVVGVPALLLRPLVENAVTHGLTPARGGFLRVEAAIEAGRLSIVLSNTSGGGAAKNAGLGLGLSNVTARLHHRYGAAATLTTGVEADVFVVRIEIPVGRGQVQA